MAGKRSIINLLRQRRFLALLAAAAVLAIAGAVWAFRPGPEAEEAAEIRLKEAAQGLGDYQLTLRMDAADHTLALTEEITFRNLSGETLSDLVLRTWLNAFASEETSPAAAEELYEACYPQGFSTGELRLFDVAWNGAFAPHEYLDEARTALRVQIPALKAGKEGKLLLRAVAYIPACAHRTGIAGETWQLGNVIPLLSLYQDGAWRTDPYASVGDPFVSECANFSVTLYAPEGYTPACSAPLTRGSDGAWRGSILAARDLALCVSPDYKMASGRAGKTAVYSFAETAQGARRALGYAVKALETYGGLYGEYPYPAFTVCSVDFPFGGMEYPGLVMVSAGNYLESKADSLELTIAHEAAHQWFYALVGSDQVFDPWQDEALCEYAMLRYVRARYGAGSYEALKSLRVDAPQRENVPGNLTPGSPIDYFGSLTDYATVVYGRGAALLVALDEMLTGGVDGFLRAYVQEFAFGFAQRLDFEESLNRYAGMDVTPLLLDYLDTAR